MPLIGAAARSVGRPVLVLTTVLLSCGCATLRIEPAGQDVRVERYWGVLAVDVGPSGGSHAAELTALGVARSPLGWSAGFTHQRWAALGPECRLVIWASTPEHLRVARELANSATGVCVDAFSSEEKTEVRIHETEN